MKISFYLLGVPKVDNYTVEDVMNISEEYSSFGEFDKVPNELQKFIQPGDDSLIRMYSLMSDAGQIFTWFKNHPSEYQVYFKDILVIQEEELLGFQEISEIVLSRKLETGLDDYADSLMPMPGLDFTNKRDVDRVKEYYKTINETRSIVHEVLHEDIFDYHFVLGYF